jgi:uncharacterized glyoxalase superfamily protein PhnB
MEASIGTTRSGSSIAFYVDSREEVDAAYQRCLEIGAQIHFPPEEDRDIEGPGLTCTGPATP